MNFEHYLVEWFGQQCSIAEDLAFAIQFAEISLQSHADNVGTQQLPDVIQAVNKLIERHMPEADYSDPRYSYRVYVAPRTINNRNKADQAVIFAPAGSAIEMAIREVERPKYSATQIVQILRKEGHDAFTMYAKGGFVEFWKRSDAKLPGKGFGVEIARTWYWYDKMLEEVRAHLIAQQQRDAA